MNPNLADATHALRHSDPLDFDDRTQCEPAPRLGNALPLGHELRHFRIDGLIGEGGFGIVYRAHDLQLRRTVAIKEYMPASLAMRCPDLSVAVRSPRCAATFERGLRSFILEAQTLAGLERTGDALVEVHDFWEADGTAYMVMRCYEGPTLRVWRLQQAQPPDEATLCALLAPLLDVVERIHAGDPPCFHRDIAPDNIMLLGPTRPLLLDFGAARRVIADATQDLAVIFKPGYAPIEQYGESDALQQGPWTDVYALCAVLHFAITGEAPLPSVNRLGHDALQPLATRAAGRYSPHFLAGIDAGLRLLPAQRPQDMTALRRRLLPALAAAPGRGDAGTVEPRLHRRHVLAATAGLATAALASLAWRIAPIQARPPPLPTPQLPPAPPADPFAPPVEPAAPFTLDAALQDIVDRAEPQRRVTVTLRKPRLTIGQDALHYRIASDVPGHVYVYLSSSDQTRLYLLFPDEHDRDNHILGREPLELPRAGPPLVAMGPAGTDLLLVVVSAQPRNLAGAGLLATQEATFDLGPAQQAWAAEPGSGRRLLGKPTCAGSTGCDERYGAALVRIEEV